MRILIATWHRSVVGGAETYLRALIPQLLQRGHEIAMVHGYPVPDEQKRIDSSVQCLPAWCWQDLGTKSLLEEVQRWAPDVVYSHGLDSVDLESALIEQYPSVFYAHGYYGTCATGAKCHSRPRRAMCSRAFGPMCLVLHYPLGCGGLHPRTTWNNYRAQAQRHSLLRHFPAILVASQHMRKELSANGVDPAHLHLVPLPPTDIQPETHEPVRKPLQGRILLSCRLTKNKGGDYLLKAIPDASRALDRPLEVIVAGAGAEEQHLRSLAARLGVSARFVGWASGPDRPQLIRECDLVAFPSIWPEPFGLSGIEAGCLGVPGVGYEVGGIPEWLIPGYSGELAPADPPTPRGLAQAIVRALADSEHYNQLCLGAWTVARQYNWPAHLEKLDGVLRSVTSPVATPVSSSSAERR